MKESLKKGLNKIKEGQKKIRDEVMQKAMGYILAGLGLVVGLAWNDAVKSFIEYIFPLNKNSILAKFIYALLVTLLIVTATIILTKKSAIEENKELIK